jgi:alpha-mannosidase
LLYKTEKICSVAALKGVMEYPTESIKNATKSLLLSEFHDALSGCCIEQGEAQVLNHLGKAITLLERAQNNAFYAMTLSGDVAKPGEYPIYVFNPHPYDLQTNVECELCLAEQNCTEQVSVLRVYDENGNELVSQTIKEDSNLNIDWRRRVIFQANLKALEVTRFSVYVTFEDKKEKSQAVSNEIVFDNGEKKVVIDTKSGLLVSYEVNGKETLKGGAFAPYLYDDNADPWGMDDTQLTALGVNPVAIPLAEQTDGIFEKAKPVSIVEDGDVCLTVQSIFAQKDVKVRLQYIIYKKGVDIDVKADVFFNEKDKIVKLHVPTVFENSNYYGQTAYGVERLDNDGREVPSQRFVYVGEDNEKLAILNNCTYGSAMKNGVMAISLLRGAGYCVHPMLDRPLIPDMQYVQRIDQGESNFSFKLTYAPVETLERLATEFNQPPYALNVFPIAMKRTEKVGCALKVDNKNVVLTCFKKADRQDGYVLRLFNNDNREAKTTLRFKEGEATFKFGAYEVKTVLYQGGAMQELDEMII